MRIPTQVSFNKKVYAVHQPPSGNCRGVVDFSARTITIYKRNSHGFSYPPSMRSETFWHELTHAILDDMQHKLALDEKFVTQFSQRLDQAVRSAKFK